MANGLTLSGISTLRTWVFEEVGCWFCALRAVSHTVRGSPYAVDWTRHFRYVSGASSLIPHQIKGAYYYTCHKCGANYCYAHMERHSRAHHQAEVTICSDVQ